MKKIISILSLTLLLCYSASAQTSDEKYAKTLKKMFEVSGTEENYKVAIVQMLDILKDSFKDLNPETNKLIRDEFLNTSLNDLTIILTPVYAKHLSLSDLESIIKFYESPAGKNFSKSSPLILAESMEVGKVWGAQIGLKLMEKINALEGKE